MLNQILIEARSQLGVVQGSSAHKKMVDAYNRVKPLPVGYRVSYWDSWCDLFITVVFDRCGLSNLIGRECGVQRHIQIFKNKGIWMGKVRPQAGDLITFDWNRDRWADHIGIVERIQGSKVYTIEGNTSRQVARRSYQQSDSRILGYARPQYASLVKSQSSFKPPARYDTIVKEILAGKWGNGSDRIHRLKRAGYNASQVQAAVNARLKDPNYKIAKEVLAGKWGNGKERIKRLKEAGHDPVAVQKLVNVM